jgi:hypothetical protein
MDLTFLEDLGALVEHFIISTCMYILMSSGVVGRRLNVKSAQKLLK